jgi:endoglucanase
VKVAAGRAAATVRGAVVGLATVAVRTARPARAAVGVLAVVAAVAATGCGGESGTPEAFLERYVDDDGRVVRHDQGGDTVSEGQAYALLLATAAGDEERFARVWSWTRANLRRPDGLLSWRWADGRVVDAEPAADADLDAARALMRAAERFGEPAYAADGRALIRAVRAHETAAAADKTVLVAGPWARDETVVNPSYWSPRGLAELGLVELAASSRRLTQRLTESGLPSDWARVEAWGVEPIGPPSGGEPTYSYDAVRVPVHLVESCDPVDRALAAGMWPRLREQPGAPRRALDGTPLASGEHPAALAGAAAAAHAAGAAAEAERLLERAAELDEQRPTYYGGALVALSRLALQSGGCSRP